MRPPATERLHATPSTPCLKHRPSGVTTIINKAKHEMNDEAKAEGHAQMSNDNQAWLDDASG